MNDRAFEEILYRLRRGNGSGYPVLYPPMPTWRPIDDSRLLRAWERSPAGEPLDLHVRVPFCRTICSFCFLPVRPLLRKGPGSYLASLERELQLGGQAVAHRSCRSLYLAGGTPNLLPLRDLERLLTSIHRRFRFTRGAQWAMDANPEFLTSEQARVLKACGVHWLTIGVQSLDDAVIGRSARTQTNSRVRRAYENARKAGIGGINIDLMCGLPGQSKESFLSDVRTVLRWRPEQVHVYLFKPLAITPFARAGGAMAGEDVRRWKDVQREAMESVLASGYRAVDEESAALGLGLINRQSQSLFARPFSMLGLGMGAVSLIYMAARYVNVMDQSAYEAASEGGRLPVERGVMLSPRCEMINYLLLQFSEADAVSKRRFERIFAADLDKRFGDELGALVSKGVLRRGRAGYEAVSDKAYFEVPKALYEPKVTGRLMRLFGLEACAS